MDEHKKYISKMCRICTNRTQTFRASTSHKVEKPVERYSDLIYILFGIDICDDDSVVHPKCMCDECYQLLMNSKKTGYKGEHCVESNLSGVYGVQKDRVEKLCRIWKPHSNIDCQVCQLFKTRSIPRTAPKKKRGGGIKFKFNSSSSNIFEQLFDDLHSTILQHKRNVIDSSRQVLLFYLPRHTLFSFWINGMSSFLFPLSLWSIYF